MDNGTPGAHVGEPPPSGPIELVELVIPGTGVVDREEVLRPPGVRQVSGDDSAGWYRPAEEDTDEPRTLREVYDWPRLLIGGAGRAVWLFLLPFLMINLVTWMEPRLPERSWPGALYSFGARLLGLSLTVMLVGVFGQAVMDQVVWQCGADTAACVSGNFAVTAARDRDTGTGGRTGWTRPPNPPRRNQDAPRASPSSGHWNATSTTDARRDSARSAGASSTASPQHSRRRLPSCRRHASTEDILANCRHEVKASRVTERTPARGFFESRTAMWAVRSATSTPSPPLLPL